MTKWTLSQKAYKNPEKIFTKNINRYFPKNDFKIVLKFLERDSTLLTIREMKSKTTLRFAIMAKFQKILSTLCWKNCGEIGILIHCKWEWKVVKFCGRELVISEKKITWAFIFQPSNPNSRYLSWKYMYNSKKNHTQNVTYWRIICNYRTLNFTEISKCRRLLE